MVIKRAIMFKFKRIFDEGSSEPFFARLWLNILELRDFAIQDKLKTNQIDDMRNTFDTLYEPVLNAVTTCRTVVKESQQLIEVYRLKVSQEKVAQVKNNALHVSETIDKTLKEKVSAFHINGARAIKGVQTITKLFDIDIGSFFQKPSLFERGLIKLKNQGHILLANYLKDTKTTWSESFIEKRNDIEHEGWNMPDIDYKIISSNEIEIVEPEIDRLPVSLYLKKTLNDILNFVENIIIYTFRYTIEPPLFIREIPINSRDPLCPKRFEVVYENQKQIDPMTLFFEEIFY